MTQPACAGLVAEAAYASRFLVCSACSGRLVLFSSRQRRGNGGDGIFRRPGATPAVQPILLLRGLPGTPDHPFLLYNFRCRHFYRDRIHRGDLTDLQEQGAGFRRDEGTARPDPSKYFKSIFLTCLNMALYADVSGKQFPVTRGQDVGRYQVSWSLEHKSAHAGTYEVRFFDEESYSLLRKAQRNNEDVSIISPLFTVNVDHRGTWNGPWVSTEVLAAAIGIVVYYLAFSAKSHIQA
ncbi:translocon-associated protein subunit delta isoform X2 [Meriones unguiculatus]|uniref:translocon-associated protein subunit delta isoform X2 n=1 Tax=Meriones unguiculatus TaxID=10047 RepID=UPI00293E0A85|nr:translocon-associated protein subunit delta isoform X2 [Meriones unguiculatus]